MTREAFDTLVNRLEAASGERPERLTLRAAGVLILGYLALSAAAALGLAIAAVGAWLLYSSPWTPQGWLSVLLVPAGLGMAFLILGCLWVPTAPPKGFHLDPNEVPELFRLLDQVGSRRVHGVILDGELNASVVQTPRLGLFGWHRTWLVIGLPLMHALPPDEFRAVLAHEFAHLRGRGAVSRWLHRTRSTWERAMDRVETHPWCPMLGRILAWIWPRFNAPACLLSRLGEFECDRIAAEQAGARPLAGGLKRLAIQSRRSEEIFWQSVSSGIRHQDTPPEDVIQRLRAFLKEPIEPDQASRFLQQALRSAADSRDSHPGLAERLDRLGFGQQNDSSVYETPPEPSAADSLLPSAFQEQAEAVLSLIWQSAANERWHRKHIEALSLEHKSRNRPRTVRESWQRIAALSRVDGLERMQPEILSLLDRKPDHAGALYLRGCHLAQKEDPRAIGFLERAANDPTISVQAFDTLAEFHRRAGRNDEIANLKRRADRHEREMRAALVERNKVNRHDTFASHELDEACLESLREALADHPTVKRAWLVAKHVRHFPHWRHFVLVLVLDVRWPAYKSIGERARQQLLTRIVEDWEVDGYVLALREETETRWIARTIRRLVPDCEVYRRP